MIANLNDKTLLDEWFKAARCDYPQRLRKLGKVAKFDHNITNADGQTALHLAARCNATHSIECLLSMPEVRVNTPNNNGLFPLFEAAGSGSLQAALTLLAESRVEIQPEDRTLLTNVCRAAIQAGQNQSGQNIRALLSNLLTENGTDVNKSYKNGAPLLSVMIQSGKLECAKLLLSDSRVDVNKGDHDGDTPLIYAVRRGEVEFAKLLMSDSRVDVNRCDKQGRSPLYCAVNCNNAEYVRLLLSDGRVHVNESDCRGYSPLCCAVSEGRVECAKLLLADRRVDVNASSNQDGPPLCIAAGNGQADCVRLLLSNDRVNVNRADRRGNTPLICAADNGRAECVRLLLADNRVDVNMSNNSGATPLLRAAIHEWTECVELLMANTRVDVNKCDNHGGSPFAYAAAYGQRGESVKLLMANSNVNVNTIDEDGDLPLVYAIGHGNVGNLKLLMADSRVKVNEVNNKGETPLIYAIRKRKAKCVEQLLADNRVDVNKGAPLLYAAQEGLDDIVRLLCQSRTSLWSKLRAYNSKSTVSYCRGIIRQSLPLYVKLAIVLKRWTIVFLRGLYVVLKTIILAIVGILISPILLCGYMSAKDVGGKWIALACGLAVCLEWYCIKWVIEDGIPRIENSLGIRIFQEQESDRAAEPPTQDQPAESPEQPSQQASQQTDQQQNSSAGESAASVSPSPVSANPSISGTRSGTASQQEPVTQDNRDTDELVSLIDELRQETYRDSTLRLYQRRLLRILPRIAAGESVNTVLENANGTTALHNACGLGHYKIVKWLVDHGADCTRRTAKGADVITCIGKDPQRRIEKLIKSKLRQ